MTRKYQHSFIKDAFILNGKDIVEFIHVLVDFMGNKLLYQTNLYKAVMSGKDKSFCAKDEWA